MRVFDVLRAMDAYVGDQDSGAITCRRCGAVVEDDALTVQTAADGQPKLGGGWYCRRHLVSGALRLQAAIEAQRKQDHETQECEGE